MQIIQEKSIINFKKKNCVEKGNSSYYMAVCCTVSQSQ